MTNKTCILYNYVIVCADINEEKAMAHEPTHAELNALYGWAMNKEGDGCSRYPDMSFEDGVMAVIDWLRDDKARPDTEAGNHG